MKQREVVLSPSDLWKAFYRGKERFLLGALLCAVLLAALSLTKPVQYTAVGIFKAPGTAPTTIVKMAETLLGSEPNTGDSIIEPKVLMKSLPVLEQAVKKLGLQAWVAEEKSPSLWDRALATIRAEWSHHVYRLVKRPHSDILAKGVIVADRPILPYKSPRLLCKEIHYPEDYYTNLMVTFHDETQFEVRDEEGNAIGTGFLQTPFLWDKGAFTLEKKGASLFAQSTFRLAFIPVAAAAQSLKAGIVITREKESKEILKIKYTHADRQLAQSIVNAVMEGYRDYVQSLQISRIEQQLNYLERRKGEAAESLEKIVGEHRQYLEENLGIGGFLSLEAEIEFMTGSQSQLLTSLHHLASEKEYLQSLGGGPGVPGAFQGMNLRTARDLHQAFAKQLSEIQVKHTLLHSYETQLCERDCDLSALSTAFQDATLSDFFLKIHQLHLSLLDAKNWSAKEQAQLKEELDTQKAFLVKHIGQLKEIARIEEHQIQERAVSLQKRMVELLENEYALVQKQLVQLTEKMKALPEKWLSEQKIKLNSDMHMKFVEGIANFIENKNTAGILALFDFSPLEKAELPVLPDPPRLFFRFVLGFAAALFAIFLALAYKASRLGPSASKRNLLAAGCHVSGSVSSHESLRRAALFLDGARVVLLASSELTLIATFLEKKGDRVLLVNLDSGAWVDSADPSYKLEFLRSKGFLDRLETGRDSYDCILLQSSAGLDSLELQVLFSYADAAVISACDHTLEQALFFAQTPGKRVTFVHNESAMLPLKAIAPRLASLQRKTTEKEILTP